MNSFKYILASMLILSGIAYSGAKKDISENDTRSRAKSAYDELDNKNKVKKETKAAKGATRQVSKEQGSIETTPKPVIMVLPSINGKGASSLQQVSNNPFAKAVMDGLNDYLAQKHYEVKSLEGSVELEKIIQMQNDIAGNDEDLAYLASLALNADIYIKFTGSMDSKGFVTVDLSAYEASTARLLGSQNSSINSHGRTTDIDQQANLKSAAKKAMPSIEAQILSYWKEELKQGTQYKVIMNITGNYTDSSLEDLQDNIVEKLKPNFNKVKVNSMTSKTIDLVVYAQPDKYEDVNEVYKAIRQSTKSLAESKKLNITKKLIVMEVK